MGKVGNGIKVGLLFTSSVSLILKLMISSGSPLRKSLQNCNGQWCLGTSDGKNLIEQWNPFLSLASNYHISHVVVEQASENASSMSWRSVVLEMLISSSNYVLN